MSGKKNAVQDKHTGRKIEAGKTDGHKCRELGRQEKKHVDRQSRTVYRQNRTGQQVD